MEVVIKGELYKKITELNEVSGIPMPVLINMVVKEGLQSVKDNHPHIFRVDKEKKSDGQT